MDSNTSKRRYKKLVVAESHVSTLLKKWQMPLFKAEEKMWLLIFIFGYSVYTKKRKIRTILNFSLSFGGGRSLKKMRDRVDVQQHGFVSP